MNYSAAVFMLWIFQQTIGVSTTTTLTPNLGELCPGQNVVLTTEGVIEWLYNGVMISGSVYVENADSVGDIRSLQASGFMFRAELISERPPEFASTLSFSAATDMNGDSISCIAGGQTSTQTIQVQMSKRIINSYSYVSSVSLLTVFFALVLLPSPPINLRLTSIMNNSESASVTIEWDPIPPVREGVHSITPSQLPLA